VTSGFNGLISAYFAEEMALHRARQFGGMTSGFNGSSVPTSPRR
jgi:hypothetical protein